MFTSEGLHRRGQRDGLLGTGQRPLNPEELAAATELMAADDATKAKKTALEASMAKSRSSRGKMMSKSTSSGGGSSSGSLAGRPGSSGKLKRTPRAEAEANAPPTYQKPVIQVSGWVFVGLSAIEGAYTPVESVSVPLVSRAYKRTHLCCPSCSNMQDMLIEQLFSLSILVFVASLCELV